MAVTLIIEDGTGVANANAYDTFENVSAYFESRGYVWETSPVEDDQLTAIIRGTSALDALFGYRLGGKKVKGRAQSLAFPRENMTDAECEAIEIDEIPKEWLQAFYELTWREYNSPGSLMPDYTQSERTVQETLGPLSVTYASNSSGGSAADAQPVLTLVEKILQPLLGNPASDLFGTTTRV